MKKITNRSTTHKSSLQTLAPAKNSLKNSGRHSVDANGSVDLLKTYVNSMGNAPLLTAEEEKELAIAAQADDQQARNILMERNLRLVISIARGYQGRGVALMDIIQEGNIALDYAIRKFDTSRGLKFSTYATPWIHQACNRAVMNYCRTIRLPIGQHDRLRRLGRNKSELEQALGREASIEELAASTDTPREEIELMFSHLSEPLSINTPPGKTTSVSSNDDSRVIGDSVADEMSENALDNLESRDREDAVSEALSSVLSEREVAVIKMRYGLDGREPLLLADIGATLGITRERARQIERGALNRLRTSAPNLKDHLIES